MHVHTRTHKYVWLQIKQWTQWRSTRKRRSECAPLTACITQKFTPQFGYGCAGEPPRRIEEACQQVIESRTTVNMRHVIHMLYIRAHSTRVNMHRLHICVNTRTYVNTYVQNLQFAFASTYLHTCIRVYTEQKRTAGAPRAFCLLRSGGCARQYSADSHNAGNVGSQRFPRSVSSINVCGCARVCVQIQIHVWKH